MDEEIKQEFEKKPWLISMLVAVLFVALVLGIVQRLERQQDSIGGLVIPELTEATCSDAGGDWESCGSACRGEEAEDPGVVCAEVCVEYCHCHHDGECPHNHVCSEVIEDTGVCVIEF